MVTEILYKGVSVATNLAMNNNSSTGKSLLFQASQGMVFKYVGMFTVTAPFGQPRLTFGNEIHIN